MVNRAYEGGIDKERLSCKFSFRTTYLSPPHTHTHTYNTPPPPTHIQLRPHPFPLTVAKRRSKLKTIYNKSLFHELHSNITYST